MVFWIFFVVTFVIGIVGLYRREWLAAVLSFLLVSGMGISAFFCWSQGYKFFHVISELPGNTTYCLEQGTSSWLSPVLKYEENGFEYTGYLNNAEYIKYVLLTDCFFLDEKRKIHPIEGGQPKKGGE